MSYWRTVAWRLARDPTTLVAGGVLVLIVLSAILAPWLAPYDPTAGSIRLRLAPVGAPGHLLGTDEQGRDMLSRLLWGGRMTLVAGLTPVVVAFVVGAALGVLAGYVGGLTEHAHHAHDGHLLRVSRPCCSPSPSRARSGPACPNTLISLSIVFMPRVVRVAESATVQVKGLEYIAAARASGAGVWPIVRHHLLANVLGPILVFASTQVSLSIILAAGLSFLGLGVTPPAAEWGLMLNTLRQSIYVNAIVPALPGAGHLRDVDGVQPAVRRPARRHGDPRVSTSHGRRRCCEARGLRKHFPLRGGMLQRTYAWVRAVDDVSFDV